MSNCFLCLHCGYIVAYAGKGQLLLSVGLPALRQDLADLFDRQRVKKTTELCTLGFFVRRRKRVVLREEGKTFHAAPFFLHGSVSGIVFRHLRAHVSDDGLNDRKRDSGNPGVVTERMTAGVQILHAHSASTSFHLARGLNPQSFEELLDPVGNAYGGSFLLLFGESCLLFVFCGGIVWYLFSQRKCVSDVAPTKERPPK